jgi:hypothetical protein
MSPYEREILGYVKSDLLPERLQISEQGLVCTESVAGHWFAPSSTGGIPFDILKETTENSHFIPWGWKLYSSETLVTTYHKM